MAHPDPNRPIYNHAVRYAAVGNQCVYWAPGDQPHRGRLSEEHIIPASMEGRMVLPFASCRGCMTTIGKFENKFFQGTMDTAREHLGLQGRQKKNRTKLIVRRSDGGTLMVPKEDHPSILVAPRLLSPGFVFGSAPTNDMGVGLYVGVASVTDNLHAKAARIGAPINLTRGLDALDCYRQIAKIAHSFAVAELGEGAFTPLLLNLIHGREPMLAGFCVGSGSDYEPPSDYLHEIGFIDPVTCSFGELVVVRVRLFSHLPGTATHYAAAGIRTAPSP